MYFEYFDGRYAAKIDRAIPSDLGSNLDYIAAPYDSGASGILLGRCPTVYGQRWTMINLSQIYDAVQQRMLGMQEYTPIMPAMNTRYCLNS